jgi:hypothetical protein
LIKRGYNLLKDLNLRKLVVLISILFLIITQPINITYCDYNSSGPLEVILYFPEDYIIRSKNAINFLIENITLSIRNISDDIVYLNSILLNTTNTKRLEVNTTAILRNCLIHGVKTEEVILWNITSQQNKLKAMESLNFIFNITISKDYKGGNINIRINWTQTNNSGVFNFCKTFNLILVELIRGRRNGIHQSFNISIINAGNATLMLNESNIKVSLNSSDYFEHASIIKAFINDKNIENMIHIPMTMKNISFQLLNLEVQPGERIKINLSVDVRNSFESDSCLEAIINYSGLNNYMGSIVRDRIQLNFSITKRVQLSLSHLLPYIYKISSYTDGTPISEAILTIDYNDGEMKIFTDDKGESIVFFWSEMFWPFLTNKLLHLTPKRITLLNGEEFYIKSGGSDITIFGGVGSLLIICIALLVTLTLYLKISKEEKPVELHEGYTQEEIDLA